MMNANTMHTIRKINPAFPTNIILVEDKDM